MKSKIIIGILFAFILIGCTGLPQEEGKVWVEKHLTQCAEEWQGWVYSNYDSKSRDQGIIDFYSDKGITIFNIERERINVGIVCQACDCSSGTKLFLQISDEDKDYFLEQGYR